jgi:hypothetical protein
LRKGLDASFIAKGSGFKSTNDNSTSIKRAAVPAATAHYFGREKEHGRLEPLPRDKEGAAVRQQIHPKLKKVEKLSSLFDKIDLITDGGVGRQLNTRLKQIASENGEQGYTCTNNMARLTGKDTFRTASSALQKKQNQMTTITQTS